MLSYAFEHKILELTTRRMEILDSRHLNPKAGSIYIHTYNIYSSKIEEKVWTDLEYVYGLS